MDTYKIRIELVKNNDSDSSIFIEAESVGYPEEKDYQGLAKSAKIFFDECHLEDKEKTDEF